MARIRAVLRRTGVASAPTSAGARFDDLELDEDSHEVRRGGTVIELSPTEFKLLRYLMLNPNRVLSKAQILDHVWAYDFAGEAGIVESYISYLRRKIDAVEPPLIHTKRGVGLRPAAAPGVVSGTLSWLPLRTRLVGILLVALVAALAATGYGVQAVLRGYLVKQIDDQLTANYQVAQQDSRILNGIPTGRRRPRPPSHPSASSGTTRRHAARSPREPDVDAAGFRLGSTRPTPGSSTGGPSRRRPPTAARTWRAVRRARLPHLPAVPADEPARDRHRRPAAAGASTRPCSSCA